MMRRHGKVNAASGGAVAARRPQALARSDTVARAAPAALPGDAHSLGPQEVLCVIRNALPESVSVRASATQPVSRSFLHGTDADLEPGGHMAFVGAISDGIMVGTEFGTFSLVEARGRPVLAPVDGMKQSLQHRGAGGAAGLPAWTLTCQIESSSQLPRPAIPAQGADLGTLIVL